MILEGNNSTARDVIISSIRSSLSASAPFDAVRHAHHPHSIAAPVGVAIEPAVTTEAATRNFCESLDLIGTRFAVVPDEAEAASYLNKVIEDTGASTVIASNSETVETVSKAAGRSDFIHEPTRKMLFDSDLGVTSAQWAIAETGTLVLESESEDHRLISLVPPVHLCILKASRIRQTLGEVLELTGKNLSRTVTFITGASRTSDIELTLAIGVHGPGELHVIVLADR
jgi:L-lactate dehydrogenase complex protein LldG